MLFLMRIYRAFKRALKGCREMLGWVVGGFVKKLKRALKEVTRDFVKKSSEEISDLFDTKLYPLADKLDYIAEKRIDQAEKLENKVKTDIESLLNVADEKVKCNLEKLDELREIAIRDLRETVGQTDFYLENRINQISLVVMKALNSTQDIAEIALAEINILEDKLVLDTNQIVDKIDKIVDGQIEKIRNEFKKYFVHALPNPFDRCRRILKIEFKPGVMLSDIDIYQWSECYELSKLNENTSINDVLKIYGQLQQNAAMMAALVEKAIEDWIKYGLLCDFWRDTMETYDNKKTFLLAPESYQKLLSSQ